MHYLGLALYAEGSTDYHFLRPVLQRLCEEVCAQDATQPVEVSAVLALDHPASQSAASRDARILAAARQSRGAWKVLFVHADGSGNSAQARENLTRPAIDLLAQHFAAEGVGVAVVPVRETEAWAVTDGNALRQVFGTTLSDTALGLPASSAAVEAALDPKAILRTAFDATRPSGQRRRQGVSPMLNALGEQVSLARLRQLSAFSALESELRDGLQRLHILA